MNDEPTTSHGDVDLGPGATERPEGIVGPSGVFALLAGNKFMCNLDQLCRQFCFADTASI